MALTWLFVQVLLRQHNLCNAYTGGLSSYATVSPSAMWCPSSLPSAQVLLVAHFLGRAAVQENLGQAWLAFLHFVGHGFDPKREVP